MVFSTSLGRFLWTVSIILLPLSVQAQGLTSYELRVYLLGATTPLSTTPFQSTDVTCNLVPPALGSTVNPTRILWDDPDNIGKSCQWTGGSGLLVSLPASAYEATLVAINAAGPSGESNKAPFSRLNLAPVPQHLLLTR